MPAPVDYPGVRRLQDQDSQDLSKLVQPASLDELLILQKELKAGFADENFQERIKWINWINTIGKKDEESSWKM